MRPRTFGLILTSLMLVLFLACEQPSLFQSSREIHITADFPSAAETRSALTGASSVSVVVIQDDGTNVGNGVLTWNDPYWEGTIDLAESLGQVTFVGLAENASGEVLYLGNGEADISTDTSVTIATGTTGASGTVLGMRGPAGGYIYYAKDVYSEGWRFLEAAPSDFFHSWEDIPIDANATYDGEGNVVLKEDSSLILSIYDWYWGPADYGDSDYATVKPEEYGESNTILLAADDVSGVTPQITKGKGRPQTGAIKRRDTAKTIYGGKQTVGSVETIYPKANINGYTDWVIPAKNELMLIMQHANISSGTYWSSTEYIGTTNTSSDEDYTAIPGDDGNTYPVGTSYFEDDVYAWQVSSDGVASLAWRNQLARVRPSRSF